MICQNCEDFEFYNDVERYFVRSILSKPLNYFSGFATENSKEDFFCSNCGKEILVGDLYLEDEGIIEDSKEELFEELAKVVMDHIEACDQCEHGNLMNDIRHSIESIFDDDDEDPEAIFDEYRISTELHQLIWDVTEFDENFYEEIVKYISCPHCKNGSGPDYDDKIDYGRFELYTEVYTKKDIQLFESNFYGESYVTIKREIEKIADVCTYEELEKLKNEFLKNPLFIQQNQAFVKIFDLLKNLYLKENFLLLHKSKRLYRARVNESSNLFPPEKMWEAPVEYTRQNRYNMSGFPVLYCANSKDILYKEVPNNTNNGYTFATFRLLKPFKMFKINAVFGYEFQGFIEEPVPTNCENNAFKIQYIMTNIMALITKEVGYDGIVYSSVKDRSYTNYAFLKFERDIDIEIINISNV